MFTIIVQNRQHVSTALAPPHHSRPYHQQCLLPHSPPPPSSHLHDPPHRPYHQQHAPPVPAPAHSKRSSTTLSRTPSAPVPTTTSPNAFPHPQNTYRKPWMACTETLWASWRRCAGFVTLWYLRKEGKEANMVRVVGRVRSAYG